MKILFINPPRSPENDILKYAPQKAKHFIHKKLIGPPLGLLTVATLTKKYYDIEFIDLKGEYDLIPDAPKLPILITKYLSETNPDVVATTVIASEFDYAIEIFRTTKKYNPNILTVAGGLHTTLCPNDFTDKCVDIVCPGQSAYAFLEVLKAKEKNQSFGTINDIIINKNGILHYTKRNDTKQFKTIDANYIIPDRSLLSRWIDTYKVGKSPDPATYVVTSLGCPYKCSFCSIWPQYNGMYYKRKIEDIILELKSIPEYNVVRFADANSIVDINFIDKLCDRILEENIKKFIIMDVRADTAANNPNLIEKLAKAGLKVVICGFESFRDEELKKYNKESPANIISKAIKVFQDNGIMLRGNYVIPSDYTEDDFKALEEYADSHRVVYAGYTILTPMPGTIYYNEMKEHIVDFNLLKYNFFNCVLKTKMPLEKFHERVGSLWLIKKGSDVI